MSAQEIYKVIGYIVGSSTFTLLATKVVDFVLADMKARRDAAREAAKVPPDKLKAPVDTAVKVTPIIYGILGTYAPEGNCNICELHNGDHYLSKRSIMRMTMTAEAAIARGQSRQRDMQNIILNSAQLTWLDELDRTKEPVYYADTQQVPPGFIRDYFDYYEIKSAYFVGLFDTYGHLMGILSISSPEVDFLAGQPLTGITTQVQYLQNHLMPPPEAK